MSDDDVIIIRRINNVIRRMRDAIAAAWQWATRPFR